MHDEHELINFADATEVLGLESLLLKSVGITIGSSTSHLMFSELTVRRRDSSSSRFEITEREVIHRSPIIFTPYMAGVSVDTEKLHNPLRMMGTITDATSEKEIEQELEKRITERTVELVEVNAALKILLKQREQDKTDTEETMAANLKLMALPHLHILKRSNLHDRHKALVSLIDENFNKVSSSFIKTLISKYSVLTPKELQVAEHIRTGKTSKEIAEIMNLSSKTVDVFRYSLRKKLGLNNKKTNLQSLLSTL
jgi:DNA-binding CsgD family transcriptional regulator